MYNLRSVLSLCFLFPTIILATLSLILILKMDKKQVNRNILLAFTLYQLIFSAYTFVAIVSWQDFMFVDTGAPSFLLLGPLVWMVTKSLIGKQLQFKNYIWHFVPFIGFLMGFVYCLFHREDIVLHKQFLYFYYPFLFVNLAVYIFLSVRNMKSKNKENLTNLIQKRVFDYYFMILGLGLLFLGVMLAKYSLFGFEIFARSNWPGFTIHFFVLGVTTILFWSVIHYRKQISLETPEKSIWFIGKPLSKNNQKHLTPIKNKELLDDIAVRLNKLPLEVFQDTELNLGELAKVLEAQPYLVTQTFSSKLDTNFNHYINDKRSQIAAKLLTNDQYKNTCTSQIGLEAGFNSDASFYRAFKKYFHITPKQYQKQYFGIEE